MLINDSTPLRDHFMMTPEFAPQKRSFMIWPERQDNWRNGGKPVQAVFVKLAKLISEHQPVTMLVNQDQYLNAKDKLAGIAQVVEMSTNDAFAKDTLPIYLYRGHDVRAVNFQFNAWGGVVDGLYFPWDFDNELSIKIADLEGIDYYSDNTVIEGCTVMTDGEGTVITTEDVLLAEDRNGNASKQYIENILYNYLGAKKIIWLKEGYFLDETGGDIDNMLNYVKPGEVTLTWTDDETDPVYKACHDAYDILSNSTDAKGRHFKINKMQMPAIQRLTRHETEGLDLINGLMPRSIGQRLTASYVNYVTINGAIIYPLFDDPQDAVAKQTLHRLYPDRQIIGFPVREILIGGGGLHTIVNSLPRI